MRVLLINTNRERAPQAVVPLGLCLVASALEAQGFQSRVLDLCFARHPRREIACAIGRWRPDFIGLSVRNLDNSDWLRTTEYLPEPAEFGRVCREHCAAPLIVGGPAVSIAPQEVRKLLSADYAVAGDGEEVFPELLRRLRTGRPVSDLPGVYCSSSPARETARVENLAFISQPGRWVDVSRYLRGGSSLPIQSKRGCALNCIYCTYRRIEGQDYRLRSPEAVVEEIEEAQRSAGARSVEFVDATFNHPPGHALSLCEALSRRQIRADLSTMGLNPRGTSREMFQEMKRAGFRALLCTPDSGSDVMLEGLRKGFAADQVARTAAWIKEAGLPTLWSFLFGGPGETEKTVRESLAFIDTALGPQDRILCTVGLRVYPQTELAEIARAEGVVAQNDNLLKPAFYFSPQVAPERILQLLASSRRSTQMLRLGMLQQTCIPLALRARAMLRLPLSPWAGVPLYNRLRRYKSIIRRFHR